MIQEYIQRVTESIDYANSDETKLNNKALNMTGMSSKKVRNFLNKIVSYPKVSYLEIGVWQGSTFYSALYGNQPEYALAIDNFSEFEGNIQTFQNNMSDVNAEFSFLNTDCFNLTIRPREKFNVYFYDGNHSFDSQKLALTYYDFMLMDEFIYICDDWNFPEVPKGTIAGIEENKLQIIRDWTLPANHNGDTENWWNGLYIAVIKKSK